MICVFGPQGGHAILGYRVERISNTKSRLLVYDCNFPNQERFIDLTTDSSGTYTSWYYYLNNSYDWGSAFKNCWITYVPYADFYSVWSNRASQSLPHMEMLTVNANVRICDFEGNPVASLEDGELTTIQQNIYPVVEMGITADGESLQSDTASVWLPVDLYDIRRTDSHVNSGGTAALMDEKAPLEATVTHVDQSVTVSTTADSFSFVVDDSTELNRIMFNEDTEDGTYEITFRSTLNDGDDDVKITGSVMAHLMTFAMVNGEAQADAESLASISSYIVNNNSLDSGSVQGDNTAIISFSANGGTGNMQLRKTADDGTVTLPLCEFTAPSSSQSFQGWLIDGMVYQPGATVSLAQNSIAYAQWSGSASAYSVTKVSVNVNEITLNFSGPRQENITVAVAGYSGRDQMLFCVLKDGSTGADGSGSVSLPVDGTGAAYVRVFLLDKQTNQPLCAGFRKDF